MTTPLRAAATNLPSNASYGDATCLDESDDGASPPFGGGKALESTGQMVPGTGKVPSAKYARIASFVHTEGKA